MKMIPISERLPSAEDLNADNCVLILEDCDYFYVAKFDNSKNVYKFHNPEDYFDGYKVVSWCRLPSIN